MDVIPLHRWDVSFREAERLQLALRERLIFSPPPGFAPRLAAGADLCADRLTAVVYAGIVILDMTTFDTVEEATALMEASFPYVPGLLSFREIPALVEVWRKLRTRPDLLVLDGQGIAHPRRIGLACHAGLTFDIPTVGCAKSILVGQHGLLGHERGATAPLTHRGETVGMAVRTRPGVSPVYVSPGHLMDLPTAVELALRLTPCGRFRSSTGSERPQHGVTPMQSGRRDPVESRLPETTRRAHRLVSRLRAERQRGC